MSGIVDAESLAVEGVSRLSDPSSFELGNRRREEVLALDESSLVDVSFKSDDQ
ncbi:unnamed protein product, partial [Ilex paraguariensis]